MRVKLARMWFTPDAQRLKKGIHEIDDSLLGKLPPGAKVLEEPKAPPAPAKKGKESVELDI